jgi:hypothetical protein
MSVINKEFQLTIANPLNRKKIKCRLAIPAMWINSPTQGPMANKDSDGLFFLFVVLLFHAVDASWC